MKVKALDIILIIFFLLVALFIWVFLPKTQGQPSFAVINCNGEETKIKLPAYEQMVINDVEVIINGFEAYVKNSDCPDKTCVKTGVLKEAGQRSVCLPNKVILSLEGEGGVIVAGK